jgi:ABC-type antimicrobial peptide transport system permease subunit
MVGVETLAVGLLFGAVGALLGAIIVGLLGHWGIPASSDQMYFLYSGPRLHPALGTGNVVLALIVVLLVSMLSAFYPAILATRITPVEAMLTEE